MIAKITPVLVQLEELGKQMTDTVVENVPAFLRKEADAMKGMLSHAARHYSNVVGGAPGDSTKDADVDAVLAKSKSTVKNYKSAIDTAVQAVS